MNTDTAGIEARAHEILKEKILEFRAEYANAYDRAAVDRNVAERLDEWKAWALKVARNEPSRTFDLERRARRERDTRPPSFAEAQAVNRLVDAWSCQYRREHYDVFGGDFDSIEGALAENINDWRRHALDQVREAGKPRLASDKAVKADDLQWRIHALQRDLALFRKFHGAMKRRIGPEILASG